MKALEIEEVLNNLVSSFKERTEKMGRAITAGSSLANRIEMEKGSFTELTIVEKTLADLERYNTASTKRYEKALLDDLSHLGLIVSIEKERLVVNAEDEGPLANFVAYDDVYEINPSVLKNKKASTQKQTVEYIALDKLESRIVDVTNNVKSSNIVNLASLVDKQTEHVLDAVSSNFLPESDMATMCKSFGNLESDKKPQPKRVRKSADDPIMN